MLVSDSSAVEKVEELHKNESRKYKCEMPRMYFILVVMRYVVIMARKSVKHSTCYCALWLPHVIFSRKIVTYHSIISISIFGNESLAKKQQNQKDCNLEHGLTNYMLHHGFCYQRFIFLERFSI